jgi:hypothetical protein
MYKIIGADQKEYGPVSAEQMRQWILEGRINGQTPVQASGDAAWKPLSLFAEFSAILPAVPAGAPAPPSFAGAVVQGVDDQAAALSKVSAPAICLIVTGGLTVAFWLLSIIGGALGLDEQYARASRANQPPEVQRMMENIRGPMTLVIRVIGLAIGGFIIFGGIKMKKLESYGVCIAASIIALLPCSFCCLFGLPIGIWSLVVLNSTDVKNYFS